MFKIESSKCEEGKDDAWLKVIFSQGFTNMEMDIYPYGERRGMYVCVYI